jgi:undecaprenyl-diphosphatase
MSRHLLLSLAARFAALALVTWLAAELLQKLIGPAITTSFDAPVVQYLSAHRLDSMTAAMKALSDAGSDLVLWVVVVLGGAILASVTRTWGPPPILALAMTGAVSLEYLLKFLVGRTRPPLLFQIIPANGWSFPSGHAIDSAAVYLTFAQILASTQTNSRVKFFIFALALSITFLIGVSRVYLGIHWPTDVVVGWALGGAWSAAVVSSSCTTGSQPMRYPPRLHRPTAEHRDV